MFIFNTKEYSCPFDYFTSLIKGKWRTSIIIELIEGPKRFSELQKTLTGISAKVLSDNLKLLNDHNIIHRTVYPYVPPIVEYTLTTEGKELSMVIMGINKWAKDYMQIPSDLTSY